MNANWSPLVSMPSGTASALRPPSRLREFIDVLRASRTMVILIVLAALLAGVAYALFGPRIYEADVTVQVDDADRPAGGYLGDAAANALNLKTPASGEAEILRSRLVLGQAIANTRLYIDAEPRYVPLIGRWLARRADALSEPGVERFSGYVYGTERIVVADMEVPARLEESRFILTAGTQGGYTVRHPELAAPLQGTAGVPLRATTPWGEISLLVASFEGKPGADFVLVRRSSQQTLLALQNDLRVVEKGKQSGVIDVSWQDGNRKQLADLLNEIGRLYVRQNIDRKTAEAERTLNFLDTELPKFKLRLEQSEDSYNRFRNVNGTISLDDEARNALSQTVDLQAKLLDARQRKLDLAGRFTEAHPNIVTVDTQIAAYQKALAGVDAQIRRMPMLQQNTLRMQRDIKVNTDLYASLLNNSLQMRLAKEGRIGNVRVLDAALEPELPIRPRPAITMALALAAGLFLGATAAMLRAALRSNRATPASIEGGLGLNVVSTVAVSSSQRVLDRAVKSGKPGVHVLAEQHPADPALEGLRALRTTLKFLMRGTSNNRVLIASATQRVGKTFVAANLATLLAESGKRVLLIDADLHKGDLSARFGLQGAPGLVDLVAGRIPLSRAIHKEVLPGLDVIATGSAASDPGNVVASDALSRMLATVSSRYDIVVLDSAPTQSTSDCAAMAPEMGTILMVARADESDLLDLAESAKRLANVGAFFNGVVFNALDGRQRDYAIHHYPYGLYRLPERATAAANEVVPREKSEVA